MRIALIEFEDHVECIYSLIKILAHHNDEVWLFTTQSVHDELQYLEEFQLVHFHSVLKENGTSVKGFFDTNFDKVNQCDLLFFTTIQENFSQYPLKALKGDKYLRIHNAHTFSSRSERAKSIDYSPYILWKDFSFFIRETVIKSFRKRYNELQKNVDYYVFPDEEILAYAKSKELFDSSKLGGAIPLACSDKQFATSNKKSETYKIVITGLIDERRKDYRLVLDVMKEMIEDQLFSRNVELVLLGKPKGSYGRNIINGFKNLENELFKVKSFKDRVDQEDFEKEMKSADVLLAPIQISTRYKFYDEVYGLTKQSGSISDLIRYCKPLIIPASLVTPKTIKEYYTKYRDQQELKNILLRFISDPESNKMNFDRLLADHSSEVIYKKTMAIFNREKSNAE